MTAVVFFGGAQMVFLGGVGEFIGRIFHQVKGRPIFLVNTFIAAGTRYDLPAQFASLDREARRVILRDLATKAHTTVHPVDWHHGEDKQHSS